MNRRVTFHFLLLIAAGLLATGCATPFDIGTADRRTTPQEAVADFAAVRNRTVAWGGVIMAAKNLKQNTQFEVLGYPLDSDNRPDRNARPLGRFLIVHPGYFETGDYAPGRRVTVVGKVTETRTGTIGEALYTYPVVAAERLHLWPREYRERREPNFHIGIGVGIIR